MIRWPVWCHILPGLGALLLGAWVVTCAYAAPHGHALDNELPPGEVRATSLYQVSSTWTTATEQRLQLSALQGKARVLVLHYTSCEYACPILISLLKNIEAALEPEVRERVGFVAVTFDPAHDTPEVLRAYSTRLDLAPSRWTLLRGTPDDTLELAILLGVKYRREPQGGFAHSNLLTVLDKHGVIVHRHVGLQQSVADTLAVIRRVAQE